MKHLKTNVDLTSFINTVQRCSGDVLFQTEDGDSLNLKSVLSCYLFSMISGNPVFLLSGCVMCLQESDYAQLEPFLREG